MNVKKARYDINFTRGDTFSFIFDIRQLTEQDLTHAYMTVKRKDAPGSQSVFQKRLNSGISKIDAGRYRVSIDRADTIGMDLKDDHYMYDIEIKYDSKIKTIIWGHFRLCQDWTTPQDEGGSV